MPHTPGTWKNIGSVGAGIGIAAVDETGEASAWIAIVYGARTNPQALENAALIAAAPHLLNVCRLIVGENLDDASLRRIVKDFASEALRLADKVRP